LVAATLSTPADLEVAKDAPPFHQGSRPIYNRLDQRPTQVSHQGEL
jgi:hypothetical protein